MYSHCFHRSKFYFLMLLILMLNACSDAANQAESKIGATSGARATLVSVELSPRNTNLALNTQVQLHAIGIYSDNTKRDISDQVTWISSEPLKAKFLTTGAETDHFGVVVAKETGVSTVKASIGQIASQSIDLIITNAALESIVIESDNSSAAAGTTRNLKATGYFSDGTQQTLTDLVSWLTSDSNVAVFNNNAPGTMLALKAGNAEARAKLGDIESTPVNFTVNSPSLTSLQIASVNNTIGKGTHTQFVAIGLYDDSSTQDITEDVVWSSSNRQVAFLSNLQNTKGLATALEAGESTITAKFNGLSSNDVKLTVTASDLMEIQISTESGTQTGPIDMALNTLIRFQATGIYRDLTIQDITKDVIWVSRDTSVAVIDNASGNSGLVIPVYKGQTEITALFRGVLSKLVSLRVTNAQLNTISITPVTSRLSLGATQQYKAIGTFADGSTLDISKTVLWGALNSNVANISNNFTSAGLATAKSAGTTSIIAKLDGVTSNTASLTSSDVTLTKLDIRPSTPAIMLGESKQFTAFGTYSDNTESDITDLVDWLSNSPQFATVSNVAGSKGLATSIGEGTTAISANYQGLSATTTLTINPSALESIRLYPPSVALQPGKTQQLSASAVYSDGVEDITNIATWTSSNANVASILDGLVTAIAPGSTDITVTYNGKSNVATVTVTQSAPIVAISNANGLTTVDAGSNLALSATGGTVPYTWSVNNANASINPNTGLLTGNTQGSVTVTATDTNGYAGTLSVSVTTPPVVLSSISITPSNKAINSGDTVLFKAVGNYSDSTTADITNAVTWTSSVPATVDFTTTVKGEATSTAGLAGAVIITSTLNGVSASTQLTILSPSIVVSTTATLIQALGATVQIDASGGTAPYTWSVNDTTQATIIATTGELSPLKIGTIAVTAKDSNGYTGVSNFRISGPSLAGLFADAALQNCVNDYAASNPNNVLTTADQITTVGGYCTGYNNTAGKIISLAGIEHLINLDWLNLDGNSIADLSPLAGLSKLTTLTLSVNNISDFSGIGTLTNLSFLDISGNVFTSTTDLTPLGSLSNLTSLEMRNDKANYPGLTSDAANNTLAPVNSLVNLQNLSLSNNQITSLSFLTGLSNLKTLYLDNNANTTANTSITNLTELQNLPRLTRLYLGSNNLIDISALGSLSSLQLLGLSSNSNLNQTNFTTAFSPPNSFNQLTTLYINSTGISDISALSNLTSLTTLLAQSNNITDITPLENLTQLETLRLSNNTAINYTAPAPTLDNLTRLIDLDIRDTGLVDLSILSNLTQMLYLILDRNSIVDVLPLAPLTSLRQLSLTNATIGGQGVGNVNALKDMTQATSIRLNGANNIAMSCTELNTLITALNVGGATVVNPAVAEAGVNCTNP